MTTLMHPKVIAFDCDGTILDTFLLIEKTVYRTFAELFPTYPLTLPEAHAFFGPYLSDSFAKYVKTEAEIKNCIACYRKHSEELGKIYTKTFPGIKELLETLQQRGYTLAIVSNKVTNAIKMGLQICGLESYFDYIVGAEKMQQAKPDPDGIYQVMDHYQIQKMLFIGDTLIDIQTGKNANIPTVGVTWCKTNRETFTKHLADYIIDEPKELLKLLEGYYAL